MSPRSPTPLTRLGRFALLIDGPDFYHATRELNVQVDYKRLLAYFAEQGTLVRALYYTALLETGAADWLIRLTDWLAYNGYHVVTRPARSIRRRLYSGDGDSQWVTEVRGNVDIELAVDMLTLAPHLDTVILISGDGDFTYLVEAVQRLGCRVIVLSHQSGMEGGIADTLRRQADEFIDVAHIADEIRMSGRIISQDLN